MKIKLTLLLLLVSSIAGAQSIHVNDAGTLREITGVFINDAGTLREIKEGWINDAGTLRQFYSNLLVELSLKLHFTTTGVPGVAVANVRVHSDGNYYESAANGSGTFGAADELWLESGLANDVWVQRTITSGTLSTDNIGASRVSLASGSFDMGVTSASGGTKNAGFTLYFYDAASGGTLLETTSITVDADGSGL